MGFDLEMLENKMEAGLKGIRLVPPPPPLAVQSTAIRSASPVSTVNGASIKTERDLRSRISIVGSYALKGNVCDAMLVGDATAAGCKTRSRGVELYGVN